MKTRIVLFFFGAIVAAIIYANSNGAAANSGVDGTGASGSGGCSCHNPTSKIGTKVELDSAGVAVTSYHPGTVYTVKISAQNTGTTKWPYFGFQFTVVKAAGAGSNPVDAGTWSAVSSPLQNTPPSSSFLTETIIEQSNRISATTLVGSGASGTTYVESAQWTAPAAGMGTVIVYGVINAVNGSGSGGDGYQEATPVSITEATAALPASVSIALTSGSNPTCSGSSLTFTATATNGGNSPTYQWKVNGGNVGTNSSTYSTTGLTNGQAVTCTLTPSGGSAVNSNSITVTVNSSVTPTVSISAPQTSICSGTSLTFTASATNGGSSPSYQWKVNGSNVGSNSTTYSSSTLTNNSVVTCALTSNATCATATTATSNSLTITISAPLTPSVSISSNVGNSICSGQSATLTATPTNGGSSPSYQWLKNGSNISGATSSTYTSSTLVNGDVISVSMTSNAGCVSPATVTSNTITFTIAVGATPSVSISSNPASSICAGTSVTFTAAPTNGGSSPSYQWYKNGTVLSGATSSTYTSTNLSNNDVISVQMTSNSSCVTTTQATSNTITISISGNVTPSVSIASNAGSSICSGQNVTFTATPTNGGSSPTYQWLVNGSPVNGATGSTYNTVSLANNDVVSLSMTSGLACASPATATSNSISMSVSVGGTASVSVTSSVGTSTCTGQSATFTANPVNGGSSPTYQWFVNGNSVSGAVSAAFTPNSINNGDAISVQMTSNSTCVSQSTVSSTPITMTISSAGTPTISISANTGVNICEGQTVTYTATNTFGGSAPTYVWKKNGTTAGNNSTVYIDNSLSNGDIISCQMTSSLSCASPSTAVSNNITMQIHPLPVASITMLNDTLISTTSFTYQWYLNNIAVTGATNESYLPVANGNYTVLLTSDYGCQAQSSPYNVTYVLGINDISALSNLNVYPNPVDGNLFIDLSSISNLTKVFIRLYNLDGQVVLDNENVAINGSKASINAQNISGGVYVLHISNGGENAWRKIIVGK